MVSFNVKRLFANIPTTFTILLTLDQRFPNGGSRTPRGCEKRLLGVQKEPSNFTADERYRRFFLAVYLLRLKD